jgi:transcriptional regulator with XRE-family HTH domain
MDIIGIKSTFIKEHIERILQDEDSEFNSKANIARAMGVKPQYLNSILNGSRNVSDKFFKRFTEIFKINQIDLDKIKNEEKKYVESLPKQKNEACQLCAEKERTIQILNERIQELKETISILQGGCSSKRHSA